MHDLSSETQLPQGPPTVLPVEAKIALDESLKFLLSVISIFQGKKYAAVRAGYLTCGKVLAHSEPSVHSQVTDIIVRNGFPTYGSDSWPGYECDS